MILVYLIQIITKNNILDVIIMNSRALAIKLVHPIIFINAQTPYSFGQSTKSVQGKSPLNDLFFSANNVEFIHKNIINKVSNQTGFKILDRVILNYKLLCDPFLQYSKNQPCNLKEQVMELNRKVLNYAVDRIVVEISQYLEYKDTVNKLPLPLHHLETFLMLELNPVFKPPEM